MIDTNVRTAGGIAVVRQPSLREFLVRHFGESTVRISAVEPARVAYTAHTRDEGTAPEPRIRDLGATPTRWVRLV